MRADRTGAAGQHPTHAVGSKVWLNGIEWTVEGGRGPVYKLSHRCQRWVAEPCNDGVKMVARTVRIITHRRLA
jgi:hypothetical protein